MPGAYEVKKSKNAKYYFNLLATNGQVILSSQMYNTKSAAKKGVASVQKNSDTEERFDRRTSGKKSYFVLKAGNHQIIGTSEMYEKPAAMERGIKSVMKNGATTKIKDQTVA